MKIDNPEYKRDYDVKWNFKDGSMKDLIEFYSEEKSRMQK